MNETLMLFILFEVFTMLTTFDEVLMRCVCDGGNKPWSTSVFGLSVSCLSKPTAVTVKTLPQFITAAEVSCVVIHAYESTPKQHAAQLPSGHRAVNAVNPVYQYSGKKRTIKKIVYFSFAKTFFLKQQFCRCCDHCFYCRWSLPCFQIILGNCSYDLKLYRQQ